MDERQDNAKNVSITDLLNMEMIINQALIDILVAKGVLTHAELQAKISEIKIRSGILLSSDASRKAT